MPQLIGHISFLTRVR